MSKVKCVVLVSGLELIGELEEKTESIILSQVGHVAVMPVEGGKMGYGIIPWLPYAEDSKFSINVNQILTIFEPTVDMLNYYNKALGSGIQVVSPSPTVN